MNSSKWNDAVQSIRADKIEFAITLFLDLAESGTTAAYRELGNIYENLLYEPDYEKALYWYSRAVDEAGDVQGYLALGRLCFYGHGVEQDFKKAQWYFLQAAEIKNPLALLMLGRIYERGLGVQIDLEKAEDYYLQSAKTGNIYAMRNLGVIAWKRNQTFARFIEDHFFYL